MADPDGNTKRCSRCAAHLPVSSFNGDKSAADGRQSKCRDCQKKLRRDWYERNREHEIAKAAQWALENPEKIRDMERRLALAQPGRTTASARKWRQENPERAAEFSRRWKKANPEAVRAMGRMAYARNPDKFLAKSHRRREKDPDTGSLFTEKDVRRIFASQKGLCACCGRKLATNFERDHIIPLALNGTNDPKNIQLLCRRCNRKKSDKHPVDFMREQGYLL